MIILLCRKHGADFARQLDGECAIALYDFESSLVVFATDPLKTKPLLVNGIECVSYQSGVGTPPQRPVRLDASAERPEGPARGRHDAACRHVRAYTPRGSALSRSLMCSRTAS